MAVQCKIDRKSLEDTVSCEEVKLMCSLIICMNVHLSV